MLQVGLDFIREGLFPVRLAPGSSAGRIAALDHEVSDAAVETHALIVARLGQQDKVVAGTRCAIAVELNVDITEVGDDTRIRLLFDVLIHKGVFIDQRSLIDGDGCHDGRSEGSSRAAGGEVRRIVGRGGFLWLLEVRRVQVAWCSFCYLCFVCIALFVTGR